MKIEKKLNNAKVESIVLQLSEQIELIITPDYSDNTVEILMKDNNLISSLDISEKIKAEDIGLITLSLREVWRSMGLRK